MRAEGAVVTFNIPQGSNPGAGLVYTRDVGGGDGAVATKVVWVVVRGGDDSCGWKAWRSTRPVAVIGDHRSLRFAMWCACSRQATRWAKYLRDCTCNLVAVVRPSVASSVGSVGTLSPDTPEGAFQNDGYRSTTDPGGAGTNFFL